MNIRIPNLCSALALLLSTGILQSCKDNDFSFDNIDATMGLGSEQLELPGNNDTKEIALDDVVNLNNSDFVYIDDNGDYQIKMDGNSQEKATVSIDPFTIKSSPTSAKTILISQGDFKGELAVLTMSGTTPAEVEDLSSVTCDQNITVELNVTNTVRHIDKLTLSLPAFLEIDRATNNGIYEPVNNNKVSFSNIATGKHTVVLHVKGIEFKSSDNLGSVSFDKNSNSVSLTAKVYLNGYLRKENITAPDRQSSISGKASANFSITAATGRFHPVFRFDSFGSVALNNIPDFLSDKSVNMNLYDPHIRLDFNNSLPIAARVSGHMIARDAQNHAIATVDIPTFPVPTGNSVIVLHKQSETAPQGQTYVTVPGLGNLLKTIPDHIDFVDIKAEADNSQNATVKLGHNYDMAEQYSFSTPLQLDADAAIAYTDSIDDLNKTVKKLSFKENTVGDPTSINGSLKLEADITNRLPTYLTLTAWGTNLKGDSIPQSQLSVDVDKTVDAASDTQTPATTHLTITIKPQSNDVLHSLEGLQFRFRAAASNGNNAIVGKTINAKKQTITVKNIKLTKTGKLVGNFN